MGCMRSCIHTLIAPQRQSYQRAQQCGAALMHLPCTSPSAVALIMHGAVQEIEEAVQARLSQAGALYDNGPDTAGIMCGGMAHTASRGSMCGGFQVPRSDPAAPLPAAAATCRGAA